MGFAGGPCGLCWWGILVCLLAPWCYWGMLVWAGTIVRTGYDIPLDDGFLCRRVSPDGRCWWADWCVLLMDVCWGVLVGLLGMASGYSWELPFALGHIILFSSSC